MNLLCFMTKLKEGMPPPPPGSASETRILAVEFRNTETIYHINLLNCQTFFSCCTCSSESMHICACALCRITSLGLKYKIIEINLN